MLYTMQYNKMDLPNTGNIRKNKHSDLNIADKIKYLHNYKITANKNEDLLNPILDLSQCKRCLDSVRVT